MIKRGLGTTFDALLPADVLDGEFDATASLDEKISDLRALNIDEIAPDLDQPRKNFDEENLKELANSIAEFGVLQPIVVVPISRKDLQKTREKFAKDFGNPEKKSVQSLKDSEKNSEKSGENPEKISAKNPEIQFEIVAGERRWRAAKMAHLKKIPAIVRTLSAQHKLELSIIENVQRADLNSLEIATAYLKLKNQFNLTDAEIAARVAKSASTISNQMRLLNLPEFAKKSLASGEISEGHARQILALTDEKTQKKLLNEILKNNWSVRKAEQFVIGYKKSAENLNENSRENFDENSENSVNSGKISAKNFGNSREKFAKNSTLEKTALTKKIAKKIGLAENSVAQKITARGGEIVIKFSGEKDLEKIRAIFK